METNPASTSTNEFAAKVEEYIQSVNFNLKGLARNLGVQYSTLRGWIYGNSKKARSAKSDEAPPEIKRLPQNVREIIVGLVNERALDNLEDAEELLELAFPDKPRLQRFTEEDAQTDWYKKLQINSLSGEVPYTIHRQNIRGRAKVKNSEKAGTKSSVTHIDNNIGGLLTEAVVNPAPLPARTATAFIGREHELTLCSRFLTEEGVRLLTLSGPGGVGKTRLALEVAHRLSGYYRDGIRFVRLENVRVGGEVAGALCLAFGLTVGSEGDNSELPEQEEAVSALLNFLRGKRILIVLDNFEQALDATSTSLISTMLLEAGELQLIVTSREALRTEFEQTVRVPALPLPPKELQEPSELGKYGAIELFTRRARQARFDFIFDSENASLVVELCYKLDGLPLALELAGALLKTYTVPEMLAAFNAPLADNPIYANSNRALVARHSSLAAVIEWSVNLLAPEQKLLFLRLAVFMQGASLEAIKAVCFEEGLGAQGAIELVMALCDRSLLETRPGNGGVSHYYFLETIREYAWGKLSEVGELEHVQARLAGYYFELAKQAETELVGARQKEWRERIKGDYANFTAALDSFIGRGMLEEAGQFAAGLGQFWYVNSHYRASGMAIFEKLLSCINTDKTEISAIAKAKVFHQAGRLFNIQNKAEKAESLLLRGEELARTSGEIWLLGRILDNLGGVTYRKEEYQRAQAFYEESAKCARQVTDKFGLAAALNNLGNLAILGKNLVLAERCYLESTELKKESEDELGIAGNYKYLGYLALKQRKYQEALTFTKKSLRLYEELGNQNNKVELLSNLGQAELATGQIRQALQAFAKGLELSVECSYVKFIPFFLDYVVTSCVTLCNNTVNFDRRNLPYLVGILSKIDALNKASKLSYDEDDWTMYNESLTWLRLNVGKIEFQNAWSEYQYSPQKVINQLDIALEVRAFLASLDIV